MSASGQTPHSPSSGVAHSHDSKCAIDPALAARVEQEVSPRTIQVEHLHDGTALPVLAREHCASYLKMLGCPSRLAPAREITIGTACTGSAADVLSFDALAAAYQEHVPYFQVAYLFNCESNNQKRGWGMQLHGLCPDASTNSCCWFRDINDLAEGKALCCKHAEKEPQGCPVRTVDIFVCATSCKDFAKANHSRHKRQGGESARTLSGMNAYLDRYRPPIFLFENVDSIDESASGLSEMDIVLDAWQGMGYECQRVIINSKAFGIPASRRRVLVFGFQTISNAALDFADRSLSEVFSSLVPLARVCQRKHSCASKVLLAKDHPALQRELARRQKVRKAASASGQTGYNVQKAMDTAKQHGVPWGSFPPSTTLAADVWFQTLTRQQQDVVCYSLKVDPSNILFRDVSQSLGQTRVSTSDGATHCAAAVLPNQMMMVFADDQPHRLLLGREALVLQGFPSGKPSLSELIDATPEVLMADLGGNMVSTTVMLAMAMAAISSVPWRALPREQAARATADACAISWSVFKTLTSGASGPSQPGPPVQKR